MIELVPYFQNHNYIANLFRHSATNIFLKIKAIQTSHRYRILHGITEELL
jgi:hypothetical protein